MKYQALDHNSSRSLLGGLALITVLGPVAAFAAASGQPGSLSTHHSSTTVAAVKQPKPTIGHTAAGGSIKMGAPETAAVSPTPAAPAEPAPGPGELMLKGKIQSVTGSGRLILTVTEVTLPGDKPIELAPARTKQVVLPENMGVHLRGSAGTQIPFNSLVEGVSVIAIGKDHGPGTDLTARDVAVWTGAKGAGYEYQKPGP